jgi:V/A-type H+-transporting ATPase subunit I
MAIVDMKYVGLIAMREEKDALLRVMQRAECVEISERDASLADYQPRDQQSLAQTNERLSRLQWAISRLSRYAHEKTGMLQSMSIPTADENEALDIARGEDRWMDIVAQVEDYERQIGDLRGAEMHIRARMDQLLPWRMLDVPIERLGDTRDTSQCVGALPSERLPGLQNTLEMLPAVIRHVCDEKDSALIWILYHRTEENAVFAALKEANFSKVQFDGETGTTAEQLDALHEKVRKLTARRDQIIEAQKALASELYSLRLFYEIVSAAQSREVSASRLAETKTAFYLEGWVPATRVKSF